MNNRIITANYDRGYPTGLMTIFLIQLLFMVGFMMIFSLLVLYSTNELGYSDGKAYQLFTAYGALVYGLPLCGGYIGGRYLGYKRAVSLSLILNTLGLLLLLSSNVQLILLGLACFAVGTGFFAPCVYVLLGRLYQQESKNRYSGFTITYIGMNIGALVATTFSGPILHYWGFKIAFLIAAMATSLAAIIFYKKRSQLGVHESCVSKKNINPILSGYLSVLVLLVLCYNLLHYAKLCNILLVSSGILAGALVLVIAFKSTGKLRNNLLIFFSLGILSVLFWVIYMLAPTVLTLFVERNVDRHMFGITIPPGSIIGLDPFFIITIGPLLSFLWIKLQKRNINITAPTKIALGVSSAGIGYIILMLGIIFAKQSGIVTLDWIVLCYFFTTLGELLVAPIGFAMVGSLVPQNLEGLMMGIWQLGEGVAVALSSYLATATTVPHKMQSISQVNSIYQHTFGLYGVITLVIGLVTLSLIPLIKRIATKPILHREVTVC